MKEQTEQWLSLAEEDLKVANIIFNENIYNQVCFHCQQTAEKSLKALIEEKSKVPKEHSLPKLFRICEQMGYKLHTILEKIEFLDKFYTSTRYPFIIGMLPDGTPTKEDATLALSMAHEVNSLVYALLSAS